MADIFQEVDDDVRQDRYMALWRAYGRYLIAGLVLVVVGTGGWVAWGHYKAQQQLADARRYFAAQELVNQDRPDAAVAAFAAAATESGVGYSALAKLQEARLLSATGDRAGAIAAYRELSQAPDAPQTFREIAVLLAAMHELDTGASGPPDAELIRLAEGSGALRHLAQEMRGLWLLNSGKTSDALDILRPLAEDVSAPAGVRGRVDEVLAVIGNSDA